ncbi:prepilin-type N-terminal cleavage/methylation domain-containing protein [Pseudoalteromonas gelatinilytica]
MNKNKGFTLLEVLIAAIILFTALALASEIFKSATLSTDIAVKNAKYFQVTPSAITAIKFDLRNKVKNRNISEANGELELFGIYYSWQAHREVFNSPPTDELSDFSERNRFSIYNVEVLSKNADRERTFTFKVATW